MKSTPNKNRGRILAGTTLALLLGIICFSGCSKSSSTTKTTTGTYGPEMMQVNLVANNASFAATHVDANLINAWGMAINPTGKIWVSSTGKGVTTIYDGTGTTVLDAVTIPALVRGNVGSPTGQVFNSSSDFVIPGTGNPGKFIFADLDGSISAWNSGSTAVTVANKAGASYTGLALANDGAANFLYAADNSGGTVDVLDANYQYVSGKPFHDPGLPAGYRPYNIQNIGGMLYVTYMSTSAGGYGYSGPTGYIDVYDPNGTFVKRFASAGALSDPWGITLAPAGMGLGNSTILVGNFGDGHILAYDMNGNYLGLLKGPNGALVISGLWAMEAPPAGATSLDQNAVYFAAGPGGQLDGLVGYIKQK
jgi:uncharacterized protein (TIGR03118 family)